MPAEARLSRTAFRPGAVLSPIERSLPRFGVRIVSRLLKPPPPGV
jgi:hypothetical protein